MLDKEFLDLKPRAWTLKWKLDILEFSKITEVTDLEKIFTNYLSAWRLVSGIDKEITVQQ